MPGTAAFSVQQAAERASGGRHLADGARRRLHTRFRYTCQQRTSSTMPNGWWFLETGTNDTALNSGTSIDVDALDFITPDSTGAAGARCRYVRPIFTNISHTIAGMNITDGAAFWIRWHDFKATSADDSPSRRQQQLEACAGTSSDLPACYWACGGRLNSIRGSAHRMCPHVSGSEISSS